MEFGFPVISFRPTQTEARVDRFPSFGVDEWRLHRGAGSVIHHDISFADWQSAAMYRSMLIAARADHGTAFWNGVSRGTSDEIDFFKNEGKPLKVVTL